MPSPQLLNTLTTVFEEHQARMADAVAQAAPGQYRDQLTQLKGALADAHKEFQAAAAKLNQDLAAAKASAKDALEKAKAKSAELHANAPKPKPRRPKRGPVHDPLLEEKLQLALRTPFGNRAANAV